MGSPGQVGLGMRHHRRCPPEVEWPDLDSRVAGSGQDPIIQKTQAPSLADCSFLWHAGDFGHHRRIGGGRRIAMTKKRKASFDPKAFLAKVGEGKTISKF